MKSRTRALCSFSALLPSLILLAWAAESRRWAAEDLAGYAMAHAAWSVDGGELLCTMAMQERGHARELIRCPGDIRKSVAFLMKRLEQDKPDRFVVIWDATEFSPVSRKGDALMAEWTEKPYKKHTRVAFSYRSGKSPQGFSLLGEPLFISPTGSVIVGDAGAKVAFLKGLRSHEKFATLPWDPGVGQP